MKTSGRPEQWFILYCTTVECTSTLVDVTVNTMQQWRLWLYKAASRPSVSLLYIQGSRSSITSNWLNPSLDAKSFHSVITQPTETCRLEARPDERGTHQTQIWISPTSLAHSLESQAVFGWWSRSFTPFCIFLALHKRSLAGQRSGRTCQEGLASSLDPTRSVASQPSFVCKSM